MERTVEISAALADRSVLFKGFRAREPARRPKSVTRARRFRNLSIAVRAAVDEAKAQHAV